MALTSASGQSGQGVSSTNREHTKWISGVLENTEKIKPGMKRSDVERYFVPDGGLSTRTQRTYTYRECPYIKVTVSFLVESVEAKDWSNDRIKEISQPFLARPISD